MSVAFFTEGSRTIGLGHLYRCRALSDAFESFGIDTTFYVEGDDAAMAALEGKKAYFDGWRMDESFDIAAVDSYTAPVEKYRRICAKATTLVLDDFDRLEYPQDSIVLNPASTSSQGLSGLRYVPMRKLFWQNEKKQTADTIETILLTFGGSDPHGFTKKVLAAISGFRAKKIAVLGAGFTGDIDVSDCEIVQNADEFEMKKLFERCDIAISAGGQTLFELCATGVPTIALQTAPNQTANIARLANIGAIIYATSADDIRPIQKPKSISLKFSPHDTCSRKKFQVTTSSLNFFAQTPTATYETPLKQFRFPDRSIADILRTIESREAREKLSQVAQNAVNGDGALKVAARVLGAHLRLRKKDLLFADGLRVRNFCNLDNDESQKVLEMRNHENVRNASFEQNVIEPSAHLSFMDSLKHRSDRLYWLVYEGEAAIGVASLSFVNDDENTAHIGLYKNQDIADKGVGARLITLLEKLAAALLVKTVVAEALADNTAACVLYKKCGFEATRSEKDGVVRFEKVPNFAVDS